MDLWIVVMIALIGAIIPGWLVTHVDDRRQTRITVFFVAAVMFAAIQGLALGLLAGILLETGFSAR